MKVLAKDLRPGDVVRLEGGCWALSSGGWWDLSSGRERTVYDVDGYPFVCTGTGGGMRIDDTDWPFVLVRRAVEAHADTETPQPDDPLCTVDDLPDFKHGALAGVPATPTLDECMDALVALHKGAPRNGAMIEGILTRAGRLREAAPPVDELPVKIPVIPPTLDEWLAWAKEFQHCVNSAALYDLIARAKREK